ncbi:1,6-anhydro-N-acetylmuramyl-L-alanine amidase AmpD [uncultured Pseudoteredinibacter sp.]|uniref:1,6-anhydro-N-acetylmuramyl-L-alanine amidase AmpD n=1 Tax=uncultured Pseudoteredinibacter sp. TaxID=1641701 RepID=UPI002603B7D7|nr:1,6-anhydro-N-acetylmuramyl-L-alanine amidase AmpD [uncultured Pseudoteredinibacter sp.]
MNKQNQGWLHHIRACPSPNFNQRPASADISLLVIHNISLPPGQFGGDHIEKFFCNQLDCSAHEYFATIAELQVSAHFLIERSGQVIQFVDIFERAWHAGQSIYEGRENCNDFSIGVELEGCDDQCYSPEQYQALAELSFQLIELCPSMRAKLPSLASKVAGFHICGHSDIAPERKTDPGPYFDWLSYEKQLQQIFTLQGDS